MNGLGLIGIRAQQIGVGDFDEAIDSIQELEELGYGTVWLNSHALLERGSTLARSTKRIVIASSVASIWTHQPAELARSFQELERDHPGRFLLGIGVSHPSMVERTATDATYTKPVSSMNAWLDRMDALADPTPPQRRIIAAIWPRMLGVARDRALGSHPYLVPVDHTRQARELLGPDALLAPAHVAFVGSDADRARSAARHHVNNPYSTLPNYANNWLRFGYEPADLANGGSDRLIDAIVAWGDPDTVAHKIRGHLAAGADHVGLHVISESPARFPRREWRELAVALEPESRAGTTTS